MYKIRFFDSLAFRFSLYLILLSMGMAFISTVLKTYTTYNVAMAELNSRISNIRSSHTKSLSTALWFFDENQLKQQMRGILRDPDIIFLEVKSPNVTISMGKLDNREYLMSRAYALNFVDDENKRVEHMGEIYFIAQLDGIFTNLYHKAWMTLLSDGGKALLLSAFVFIVLRVLVIRHLDAMSTYTKKLTLNNLEDKLVLNRSKLIESRNDELDYVATAIEQMRVTLMYEVEEGRKAQDSHAEQRDLLNNILSSIPSAIYWKNRKLEYEGCNANFLREAGVQSIDEIMGMNEYILSWLPAEKEAFFDRDNRILKTGKSVILKEETLHPYGQSPKTILASAVPMYNKNRNIDGVLGIFTDVTEVKLAEKRLKDLNEELEQKIISRTKELKRTSQETQSALNLINKTNEQLVESEKMAAIGSLVAGVAHEINTPLGISVTAASHMQSQAKHLQELFDSGKMTRKDFNQFFNTCNESIDILMNNIKRSQNLISSFKQVASDQSSGECRTFKLKEYMDEIILSLKPKLKLTKHKIDIAIDEKIELYSNPGALSHVVTNLIMNSLIHGFEHKEFGTIKIQAHLVEEGHAVDLVYSDNGKGIPEEHLKSIYEPFFTTRRGSGGSGLGLHILYTKITREMKGQVKCSSVVGEGTTFEMIIPLQLPTEAG